MFSSKDGSGLPKVHQNSAEQEGLCRTFHIVKKPVEERFCRTLGAKSQLLRPCKFFSQLWKKATRAIRAMRGTTIETVPTRPYFGCTVSFLRVLSDKYRYRCSRNHYMKIAGVLRSKEGFLHFALRFPIFEGFFFRGFFIKKSPVFFLKSHRFCRTEGLRKPKRARHSRFSMVPKISDYTYF